MTIRTNSFRARTAARRDARRVQTLTAALAGVTADLAAERARAVAAILGLTEIKTVTDTIRANQAKPSGTILKLARIAEGALAE